MGSKAAQRMTTGHTEPTVLKIPPSLRTRKHGNRVTGQGSFGGSEEKMGTSVAWLHGGVMATMMMCQEKFKLTKGERILIRPFANGEWENTSNCQHG